MQMICSLCQKTVQRELWDLHKGLQCPQRMLACQYCDFELPAADIYEHQVQLCFASEVTILQTKQPSNLLQNITFLIILVTWYRTCVGIEQNIVSLAGSMSDCGNRLDTTSSSIPNPLLLQNLQGKSMLLNYAFYSFKLTWFNITFSQISILYQQNQSLILRLQKLVDIVRKFSLPCDSLNFSDRSTLEEEESYPAEEQPVRPKHTHGLQRKQFLVTIVIAGISILVGSVLLKKGWLS